MRADASLVAHHHFLLSTVLVTIAVVIATMVLPVAVMVAVVGAKVRGLTNSSVLLSQ